MRLRPWRAVAAALCGGAALFSAAGSTGRAETRKGVNPALIGQQLMTGIVAVKRWSEFIYGITPPGAGRCTASVGPAVPHPDGSWSQVSVDGRCIRRSVTAFPDQSYRTRVAYPDGLREEITARSGDFLHPPDLNPQLFSFRHRFSTGSHAEYEARLDLYDLGFNQALVLGEHYRGAYNLGRSGIRFSLDRNLDDLAPPFEDRLLARLPSGTVIFLRIPILLTRKPDFTQPATGHVVVSGRRLDFELSAARSEDRWDRLTIPAAGGAKLRGEFDLEPTFAGHGQVYRGSRLVFAAAWNENAQASLVLSSGQTTSAGPARGALDLLALRWSGLASASGPQPGR